jgi:ketosteroid isomerase-like protein
MNRIMTSAFLSCFALPGIVFAAPKPSPADTFATLRIQWAQHLHDKELDASLAEYAPDGEFVTPGHGPVRGTAGLKQLFKYVIGHIDSDLEFHSDRVEVVGDVAYDTGSYDETLVTRSNGKSQKATGTYLTVYRHKDGEWLITQQIWTTSSGDAPSVPPITEPSPAPEATPAPPL